MTLNQILGLDMIHEKYLEHQLPERRLDGKKQYHIRRGKQRGKPYPLHLEILKYM